MHHPVTDRQGSVIGEFRAQVFQQVLERPVVSGGVSGIPAVLGDDRAATVFCQESGLGVKALDLSPQQQVQIPALGGEYGELDAR